MRGKQLHRFVERDDSGGIFLLVQQKNAEIQIGFGHFGIKCDRALVLGARFVAALQRGVRVTQLEMRECHFRPFRDEFLQGSYRGFEVVSIDIALRFVEHVVEWIRYLLLPGLRLPFRCGDRLRQRRALAGETECSLHGKRNAHKKKRGSPKQYSSPQLKMLHGSIRTQKKARLAQAIQLPAIENASWFDFGNAGSICNCSRVAC